MATPKIRNEFSVEGLDIPPRGADAAHRMLTGLFIAAPGIFLASVLRGFTGFGFGLAAVPLLSLILPPARVVPLVVVLQVIVGAAGLRDASRLCDWRAIRGLAPGVILGIPIGILILTLFAADTVRLAIGALIAVSAVFLWRGPRVSRVPSAPVTMAVGMVSGVISGLASMGGPPVVVYLLALGHGSAVVRATSIIYFMMSGSISMGAMLIRGLIDREVLILSIASVPALLVGTRIGAWGFYRTKPAHHRTTALVVLGILAVVLILRALLPGGQAN